MTKNAAYLKISVGKAEQFFSYWSDKTVASPTLEPPSSHFTAKALNVIIQVKDGEPQ